MKQCMFIFLAVLLLVSPVMGADLLVDLSFQPTLVALPAPLVLSTARMLRPIRILPFTDRRPEGATFLGELRGESQKQNIRSKTEVAVYATEVFRKVCLEWGGTVSGNAPLSFKGEVTQFSLEESDGYQARVAFHFLLLDEGGNILWDGLNSGIVKGNGRVFTAESLSGLFSDILRETYTEILGDEKLVGVWSGRVSNTVFIKESPAAENLSERSGS